MGNQKKTIPKKISRITSHFKAAPATKQEDIFVGILDGKVEAIMVNSGIVRESILLGELSEEEKEYADSLSDAAAAEYRTNFDKQLQEDLDRIIQCDTFTIKDENDYERKFGSEK